MKTKNIVLSIVALVGLLLLNVVSIAQTPQKISYQTIIRDASGSLVKSHIVGIRVNILQGSESGTALYTETHSTSTNINGLATLMIGDGTPVTGIFSSIDWNSGPYYLKVETDPAGGTSYTIVGTSQIVSVPYALEAKKLDLPYTVSSSFSSSPFSIENTGSAYYTITGLSNLGYGFYGRTKATNAAGIIGYGSGADYSSGVVGRTGEGSTTVLPGNSGVLGQTDAHLGVSGTAISGIGGYFTSMSGIALKTVGGIQLTGIGESAGKLLTSDDNGNATWQTYNDGLNLPYTKTVNSSSNAFEVINSGGTAIHGQSTAGSSSGVIGEGSTYGVKGVVKSTTGTTYALWGETSSAYGFAVYGSSPYVGVYGSATANTGWGGYFNGKVGISGYLGVGTAYPGYQLDVAGTANLNSNVASGVALRCNGAEAIWYDGTYFSWGYGGTYNYFGDKVFIGATATDPGTNLLVVNGTAAKPGGGSWSTWSDSRLKDLHGNYNKGLKEILQLQPISYNYKKDNARNLPSDIEYVGFVAQDVRKIFPEAVSEDPDGYLSLDPNAIDVAVINAIRELKAENDKLKAENQELKSLIETINNRLSKLEK